MTYDIKSIGYTAVPFIPSGRNPREVVPYSPYVKYALGSAPKPVRANMPMSNIYKFLLNMDYDNMYGLINSHMWMDKIRKTPSKEDLQWMELVHKSKVRNWFKGFPVDTMLPTPKTPDQKKMLPWVTSNNTTPTSKIAGYIFRHRT